MAASWASAYVTALLWEPSRRVAVDRIPVGMAAAGVLALIVAYPCFRFRITGHYFVLVTLALSGIVLQVITATRDYTGGSLGLTPSRTKGGHLLALQFDDKITWYFIALFVWVVGLLIWRWIDRSMSRYAMEAISEDEDAAAAAGVNVNRRKAQDHADLGADDGARRRALLPVPDVHYARHRQRHFGVAADGVRRHRRRLYVSLGPTIGAVITIMLAEILRIGFGTKAVGWDNLVLWRALVTFIIFLPKVFLVASSTDGRRNPRSPKFDEQEILKKHSPMN